MELLFDEEFELELDEEFELELEELFDELFEDELDDEFELELPATRVRSSFSVVAVFASFPNSSSGI